MVSVHIHGQFYDLHVQIRNNILKDLVIARMNLIKLESIHLLKWNTPILSLLNNIHLALDTIKNTSGKSFNQDLDHSSTVDVQ